MPYDWGPHYIVPTDAIGTYSGRVLLREKLDKELLTQNLGALGLPRQVVRIVNPWYFRKKDTTTWIKAGESDDESQNFPVSWDTTSLENGQYEVMGLMHVIVQHGEEEVTVARQNVVEVKVAN
jgi:hypothetical protein